MFDDGENQDSPHTSDNNSETIESIDTDEVAQDPPEP